MIKYSISILTIILLSGSVVVAQNQSTDNQANTDTNKAPSINDFESIEEYARAKQSWVSKNESVNIELTSITFDSSVTESSNSVRRPENDIEPNDDYVEDELIETP